VGVYTQILRRPGIAVITAATLLGRLPIGISGLAILLYVREVTGSFAAAGVATGALALGSAAGAPFQGRLVDRRGVEMLVSLAFVHGCGLLLVWALGAAGAPGGALAASAFLTGASLPPLSSVLRGRWPSLLADAPHLVKSAYALDSVLIQIVFVVGPLLTTAIVALSGPEYALAVSAAAVLGGTTLLVGGLRGKPEPQRPDADTPALGLGALAAPGLRTLVLASVPLGFCFGTIQVVLPAFSDSHGARELSGVLIAVWAASSGAAGLLYGARPPRGRSIETVHVCFALLLPLGCATLLAAGSPLAMALLVPLAGAPIAPLVASRNELVERVAPRGTATEAFAWPLTALVAGVSVGASVAGSLTEAHSWSAGVLAAVAVASVGALVVLARRHTLAAPVAA
jgi:predicted MFS family arabinose efflux permease